MLKLQHCKNLLVKLLVLSLILVSVGIARAQVPGAGINFQAIARDNFSNPAKDRLIYVETRILQQTENGIVVLKEIHQANTNSEGIFNISVGNGNRVGGTVKGINEIEWSKGPYYLGLKIAIQPVSPIANWDYTKEFIDLGTSLFGTVPYALYAANAGNVDSKLNISDTANMLAPYRKLINTTSSNSNTSIPSNLSTILDGKLSIVDSITKYVTPTQLNSKTFDSTAIYNQLALKANRTDVANLTTALGLKANTIDLNSALALKANNSDLANFTSILNNKANTASVTSSLASKEDIANKSTNVTSDASSDAKYPSVKAIKDYVDAQVVSATQAPLIFTSPIVTNGNTISLNKATTSIDGYLSAGDFTSFNNKIDLSQKAANNGVATLGNDGKIPSNQIPAISFQSANVVNSQSEMLALSTAVVGSIAIRTDDNNNYVLSALPASSLSNWIQLRTPVSVTSVNGYSGPNVVLTTNDLSEGVNNKYYTDARARAALSASAPLGYNSSTGVFNITNASANTNGYLTSTDFTTFNNKQNALTPGVDYLAPNGSAALLTNFPTLNQNTTGNAATATKFAASKNINGIAFDGSSNITIAADANTLSGTTLATNITGSSLTSVGIINSGIWSGTTIAIANGGTGATNAAAARSNLGLVIGIDVLAPNTSITGSTKTKITYDSKGLVTAGADATTADISPSTNRNYVTDAQAGVISNTSGVNTGDETATTIKTKLGITTLSGSNTGDQTITLTGDVSGSGTGTFTSTLANTGVTANTYGSATLVPILTIDTKGRITSASSTSINAGVNTLTAIAGSSNAYGATISGTALTLTPADANNGGILTNGAQTIAGAKTFTSALTVSPNFAAVGIAGATTSIAAQSATSTGFAGGGVLITAGNGVGTGYGGNVNIIAGTGNSTGGDINLTPGASGLYGKVKVNYSDLYINSNSLRVGAGNNNVVTNTAVGVSALNSNSINYGSNTAIGYNSLHTNTTGQYNTSIGSYSLQFNSTGGSNTAIGDYALANNTSSDNTAVGASSLRNNTSGQYNVAVGENSIYYNQTGSNNTSVGYQSLYASSATNTSDNTAVGYQTMRSGNTGVKNTAIGSQSGYGLTTGVGNTSLGYKSLFYNTTGNFNTALGYTSGPASGTYSSTNSVFVGYNARPLGTSDGTDEIVIGANAVGLGNYSTSIGTSSTTNTRIFGSLTLPNTTQSTSTNTGALIVAGGVGIASNTYIGGTISIAGGSPGVGKVLTSDANGLASWSTVSAGTGVSVLTYTSTSTFVNGGNISGTTLTLTPADLSNPGLLSASAQVIGGAKTFSSSSTIFNSNVVLNGNINLTGNVIGGTWNGSVIPVAYGGTGVTTSTGSGSVVLNNSPTISSPSFTNTTTANVLKLTGDFNTMGTSVPYDNTPYLDNNGFVLHSYTETGVGSTVSLVATGRNSGNFKSNMVFLTKPTGVSVPTERLRIDYNGYVGIGTASPTTMLDVNGSTKIAGSLTAGGLLYPTTNGTSGQVLTSNGTGGVNWQNLSLTAGSGISIAGGTISATGLTTSNLASNAGITNTQLANSAITIGSTSISLGNTAPTLTGLTSVSSTTFSGTWSGSTIAVGNGGTGLTSPGAIGNVLTSNGTSWVSQAIPIGTTSVQTGNYTVTLSDKYIFYSTSASGTAIFTLPIVTSANTGKEIVIKNKSLYTLTVAAGSGATIFVENSTGNSSTSSVSLGISADNNWSKFVYDGTQWVAFKSLY